MEDSATSTTNPESWADQFARTLGQQRTRVEGFLAAQRARLEKAQAELTAQVAHLGDELDEGRSQSAQSQEELRRRSEELARQADDLARLQGEIKSRQAEWEKAQQKAAQYLEHLAGQVQRQQDDLVRRREELDRRQADLDAAAASLHHDRQSLALDREEHRAQVEHVAALRQRFEANLAELESLRQQYEQLRQQASAVPSAADARQAEVQELAAERDRLARQLSEAEQRLAALVARLSDAEEQLAQSRKAAGDAESSEDLQRRYEMALDDVRELKTRNQELERELARAKQAGTSAAAAAPAGRTLDWEAEKSRILAALESDFDDNDGGDRAKRLEIEEVIRTTDQVVAEKDREIMELKQLLENQSGNLGAVAVGAAALGEMLDKDAVIQEQRANLQRLQQEWEEKLRHAEIEISVERAKIARQRAEIEERLRALEHGASQTPANAPASDKPPRGRWLSRLGLSGPDKDG